MRNEDLAKVATLLEQFVELQTAHQQEQTRVLAGVAENMTRLMTTMAYVLAAVETLSKCTPANDP